MGVPGLWEIVKQTGQSHSLAHLTVVEGFESNHSGRRAYRIGIDASIWYSHAASSKGGENPELRLLFYRLHSFAKLPILPLFVFDGPQRPKNKRGSKKGKSGLHRLTTGFQKLLDIFGMEWRLALGEAEAELAELNKRRVIDAILTDDVDALVFGAETIIRNQSLGLPASQSHPALNSKGKTSGHHVMIYTAEGIRTSPGVSLNRAGLILIALLSGGDYHGGCNKFGPVIALALARCGFGDQLVDIYESSGDQLHARLAQWREAVNQELHTNSRGYLNARQPRLVVPPDFPPMDVMRNYVHPIISDEPRHALRDRGNINLPRLAAFCEAHFGEWGFESTIIQRFRNVTWAAAMMQLLRRAALDVDKMEVEKRHRDGRRDTFIRQPLNPRPQDAVGFPVSTIKTRLGDSKNTDRIGSAFVNRGPHHAPGKEDLNPLRMKVVSSREHISTDQILEYRVEFTPSLFVAMARTGILGKRGRAPSPPPEPIDDDPFNVGLGPSSHKKRTSSKPPPDPDSRMRLWLPACMIRQVFPQLADAFEEASAQKKAPGSRESRYRKTSEYADVGDTEDEDDHMADFAPSPPFPIPGPSLDLGTRDTSLSVAPESSGQFRDTSICHDPIAKSPFLFTFPDSDDPDMLYLEDGLPFPAAPRTPRLEQLCDHTNIFVDPPHGTPTSSAPRPNARSSGRNADLGPFPGPSIGNKPTRRRSSTRQRTKNSSSEEVHSRRSDPPASMSRTRHRDDLFDSLFAQTMGCATGRKSNKRAGPKAPRVMSNKHQNKQRQRLPQQTEEPGLDIEDSLDEELIAPSTSNFGRSAVLNESFAQTPGIYNQDKTAKRPHPRTTTAVPTQEPPAKRRRGPMAFPDVRSSTTPAVDPKTHYNEAVPTPYNKSQSQYTGGVIEIDSDSDEPSSPAFSSTSISALNINTQTSARVGHGWKQDKYYYPSSQESNLLSDVDVFFDLTRSQ
ncbi:hypothetical protein OF83DRAFT_1169029 [Amylostereum chailletii]|nr:hypothetical protein OF83DRAFT_1169029 [Amylostereum chailletii]